MSETSTQGRVDAEDERARSEAVAGKPADFATVWATLGLDATALALDATIRPETIAKATLAATSTSGAAEPHLSIATLPRISIRLGAADGQAVPEGSLDYGDIRIAGVLGEGGMGRVLLGRQRSLSREVAVKTVREHLVGTLHADAILGEGLVTGRLEHPNIIPIHQLGRDGDERPILVMKRIAGVSWDELLADASHPMWSKIPTLPDDRLRAHLEILMQIANALTFAHSRGVIHRDVKPENVMVGEFGEVYLVDWGIAHDLSLGPPRGLVGTPSYLAPEMLDASMPIGPRTDVHLLGGVLHTILTGRPRHEGGDLRTALAAAFVSAPVDYPETVPRELAELANASTHRDPSERPESALAFRRAISSYLSHRSSVVLSREATLRLDELDRLARSGKADPSVCARLGTECRFGFLQALREWEDNPEAKAGLGRAISALARIEIDRENLDGARALLSELSEPNDELEGLALSLSRRLLARAKEAEELRQQQHEQDLSVGRKGRRVLILMLMSFGLLISVVVVGRSLLEKGSTATSPTELVWLGAVLGAVAGATTLFRRKTIGFNEINRRVHRVVVGCVAAMFVNRVAGLGAGAATPDILRGDLFIIATALGTAGILVSRTWLYVGGVVAGAALAMGVLHPKNVELWFSCTTLFALGAAGFLWRPDVRKGAASADSSPSD